MSLRDDDPFLGVDEVARYLQLSRSTIYNMLAAGQLPGLKLGKQWRCQRSAVDAWLKAQPRPAAGLTARSINEPVIAPIAAAARLTAEQLTHLRGLWIDRSEQFVAIAATPDGRKSLAKLLSIEPERIDAIARSLASVDEFSPEVTSKS